MIGRIFKLPVIYDMAENYPAMWQIFRSKLKIPLLAKIIESIALRLSDHVMVVVEESRERLLRKGIRSQNVSIVSNTPELNLFEENIHRYRKEIFQNNKINLLYIGYLTKLRGLDTVIKALPKILKEEGKIKLNIIGDGIDLPKLKGLAKEIGVQEYVDFKGWIDFKYIPYIISKSDIGVIPHHSNEHTNTTIPNKIFDFMACGKPVIVSNARPLKRIVEKTGCGITFQAENIDDFSNKLICLIKENEKDQMGLRGKKAVKEIYNWDKDAENLDHILKIMESRRWSRKNVL
jgi:glycosyltransferase involved in cell wall biosynthesis